MTVTVVSATANPHKLAELSDILRGEMEILPRPDHVPEVIEDAGTLVGNARLKAFALRDATGTTALADDTGLEVDALDGRPGVHSARFAGEPPDDAANRRALLDALLGVDRAERTARFRTSIVLARPDGTVVEVDGVVEGIITDAERGTGGFGYDSIFEPLEGDGSTFAQMGAEKHAISHRGRAARSLLMALQR